MRPSRRSALPPLPVAPHPSKHLCPTPRQTKTPPSWRRYGRSHIAKALCPTRVVFNRRAESPALAGAEHLTARTPAPSFYISGLNRFLAGLNHQPRPRPGPGALSMAQVLPKVNGTFDTKLGQLGGIGGWKSEKGRASRTARGAIFQPLASRVQLPDSCQSCRGPGVQKSQNRRRKPHPRRSRGWTALRQPKRTQDIR